MSNKVKLKIISFIMTVIGVVIAQFSIREVLGLSILLVSWDLSKIADIDDE